MCTDNVKVILFRTYCSSLYTCHLWFKYRVLSINKLHVASMALEQGGGLNLYHLVPEHVANGRDGPRACAGAQHMCVAAFIILFRLQRDCSASGMFATHNVPSCPALIRKQETCIYLY